MALTLVELCALIDPKHPLAEDLSWDFEFMQKNMNLVAERKGSDLFEVVRRLKEMRLYPVVDKKLRLVLGTDGGHGFVRTKLFQYHYHIGDIELEKEHVGTHESQDRYVSENHGYFISSMRPSTIVLGFGYRPDSFDKDLFAIHDLDRF